MRRKRPRASTALFVLSLIIAAATTAALREHLARLEARAARPGDAVAVLVADRDLSRGTVLEPEVLRRIEVPERFAPPGALGSSDEVAGATLTADLAAGEPLTVTRLARAGPVAAQVPAGMRAMPLTVALPEGMVAPGDRVDVLAVTPGAPVAETVAVGLEVLLVRRGATLDGTGDAAATLVLLVGPDTAARLARARAFADLSVAIAPPLAPPVPPEGVAEVR